ncbi:glycerol-3-phosphate dehydrogenase, partial [Escherichia coli]
PGGAIPPFATYLAQVRARWPFLGNARSERMAHAYGALLDGMLAGVTDAAGLGADLGGGLTEIEARWMHDREWARIPEDALMRRSKIGLTLD